MTKPELVSLTLDQLIDAFKRNPECFDLDCTEHRSHSSVVHDVIMWKPRVEVDKVNVLDPNNPARTVVVINNRNSEELQCFLYMSTVSNVNTLNSHKADAEVSCKLRSFKIFDSNLKKFELLKKLILEREVNKAQDTFLNKLFSIFPGTFDEHIFGKK